MLQRVQSNTTKIVPDVTSYRERSGVVDLTLLEERRTRRDETINFKFVSGCDFNDISQFSEIRGNMTN